MTYSGMFSHFSLEREGDKEVESSTISEVVGY